MTMNIFSVNILTNFYVLAPASIINVVQFNSILLNCRPYINRIIFILQKQSRIFFSLTTASLIIMLPSDTKSAVPNTIHLNDLLSSDYQKSI